MCPRGGIVGREVDRLEGVVREGQNVNKHYLEYNETSRPVAFLL